jgi:hypothetical protein
MYLVGAIFMLFVGATFGFFTAALLSMTDEDDE